MILAISSVIEVAVTNGMNAHVCSSKLPYIEGNLHWATVELNAINRTALFTINAVM
jgi:hypothetical protein